MDVFVLYQDKFIIMCSNIFKISIYLPRMGPGIELTVLSNHGCNHGCQNLNFGLFVLYSPPNIQGIISCFLKWNWYPGMHVGYSNYCTRVIGIPESNLSVTISKMDTVIWKHFYVPNIENKWCRVHNCNSRKHWFLNSLFDFSNNSFGVSWTVT